MVREGCPGGSKVMDLLTVVMMCIFLGGVWGGFIYALWVAIRKEEYKKKGGGY
jgi:hypothetical protein